MSLALEIDSSAMCNVLSRKSANKFTNIAQIESSDIIINGASGKPKDHGKITLPYEYVELIHQLMVNMGKYLLTKGKVHMPHSLMEI